MKRTALHILSIILFLLLLAVIVLMPARAAAADIYWSQPGAGLKDGSSCANAYMFTDATNGINVASKWVPGNVLHLCGTITGVANTNMIDAKASGTPANPITIKFESGAVLQEPYFPYATETSGTTAGAITINAKDYIIIDSGTLRTTANGSSLANKQNSTGISIKNCTGCVVRNITVKPIYVHVPGLTPPDTGGFNTDGIVIYQSPNVVIDHVTVGTASFPIYSFTGASGTWNHEIKNSTISDFNEGIRCPNTGASASGLTIHNNQFQFVANWEVNSTFHNNAVHCFDVASPATTVHPLLYNNVATGDYGNTMTAVFFIEPTGGGQVSDPWAFNNVFRCDNASATFGIALMNVQGSNPVVVNNTIIGCSKSGGFTNSAADYGSVSSGGKLQNNSFQNFNFAEAIAAPANFWTTISNNNYSNTNSQAALFNSPFTTYTLPQWQTLTGGDATPPTTTVAPNVQTIPPWKPAGGSVLISGGANLTSLCTTVIAGITVPQLCSDINGVARPGAGPWDVGAAQFSSAPVLTLTPNPVNFGNWNISTTSTPITVNVANTGTATETLSTPHYTLSDSTNFQRTGGSCTDAGTIPAGSSCSDTFTCRPTVAGALTSTLTINGTVNGIATLNCTGASVAVPVVQLGPRSADFGTVATGTSGISCNGGTGNCTFTLQNTGTATLNITSISSSNTIRFPIGTNLCGGTLAPGANCTFTVTFTPDSATSFTATISVLTNASTSPDTISVFGVGFTPQPQPPPAPAPVIFIAAALPAQPIVLGVATIDPCNVSDMCTYVMSCSQCSSSTQLYIDSVQVSQTYASGVMKFKSKLTPGSHNYLAVNIN